ITQEQHLNPNEQSRDSIISKYKSYLISYFPFKENFQDCLSTSSSIPIHQIPGESPVDFTKNGFKFGESYVMGYMSDLPSKQESRTFFFWFRSTSECKIDKKTVFLFSYGHSKLNKSFGLFVGKQIGIFGIVWLAVKAGIAKLPEGIGWAQMYGLSLLCGIGFTMSLFISSLAFDQGGIDLGMNERLGIIFGSLISAVVGYMILRMYSSPVEAAVEEK
ncbi:MAG: Na+/H+ antiporter NhaA, partial [Rhizobiaceae bacterium]|nr:Na+/H+ antiporter NhaA [Rhizobiaceae bacterium]